MNQDLKQIKRITVYIEHLKNDYEGTEFNLMCRNAIQCLCEMSLAIKEGEESDG